MPREMYLRLRVRLVAILTVLAIVIWGILAACLEVRTHTQDVTCHLRLGREVAAKVFHRNELVSSCVAGSSSDLAMRCPRCDEYYGYSRLTGVRRKFEDLHPIRMVAWCPEPCHDGKRFVLVEDANVLDLTEAQFQRALQDNYEVQSYTRTSTQPTFVPGPVLHGGER